MPSVAPKSVAGKPTAKPEAKDKPNGKPAEKPVAANASKAASKKPSLPPPEPKNQDNDRPILYPEVTCQLCDSSAGGVGPITVALAKELLGWESEKEYKARMVKENPGLKEESVKYDEAFLLKDEEAQKVRCWHNTENRPFDDSWARSLAQDILRFHFAGPLTLPGETVNGETITISRTGQVKSGQHRLIGLVLASQIWWKRRADYPQWEDFPVLETILITGISDDKKVAMTVDNVKPRSEADVFYTSGLFDKLLPGERKECSRMMQVAVDMLWDRTATKGYKTHSEVVNFVERHKRLIKLVKHLFDENSGKDGRKITNLKLSAGQCAALCYLMAASASDGDGYHRGVPPSEKLADFSRAEMANDFFVNLAKIKTEIFKPIRDALGSIMDEDTGMGGTSAEKMAILSKAWATFVNGQGAVDCITTEDLALNYHTDEDGIKKLLDGSDFGGIDKGKYPKESQPEKASPSEEELQAEKERIRMEKAKEAADKIMAMRAGKNAPPTTSKPAAVPHW